MDNRMPAFPPYEVCKSCVEKPCLNVCMAISAGKRFGLPVFDRTICAGCGDCVEVCENIQMKSTPKVSLVKTGKIAGSVSAPYGSRSPDWMRYGASINKERALL